MADSKKAQNTPSSSLNSDGNKEHYANPQMENHSDKLLTKATNTNPEKEIDKSVRPKEKATDLQTEIHIMTEKPRRSERPKIPTEKMISYQKEELDKKEKRLISLYELWKKLAKKTREELKADISEADMATLADDLERRKNDITELYTEIRNQVSPPPDLRRKIDACEAVTRDIIKVIHERITGIDGDFEPEYEINRLRELLDRDYALSIYGSTAARSHISYRSSSSHIISKRADLAAEVAAKETEYRIVQEERKQKEKIKALEEHQRNELETQRAELDRLHAEKEMETARARLHAYDREIKQSTDAQLINIQHDQANQSPTPQTFSEHSAHAAVLSAPVTVNELTQTLQDNLTINRLPTPQPTVFDGQPLHFIEWKRSFMSLIGQKGIPAADKLYYLKRYVSGPALKCLEGTFFRNDEAAYQDAWKKLDQRYGQPFLIQRAFREKLTNWPKIHSKDAEGLRSFADFINACELAMPHVKGLEILNDCEENQKLTQKLPDWAAARWNRQVTKATMNGEEFPKLSEFAAFLQEEAEVACNPITSIHALRASEPSSEKGNSRDNKRNNASVLNTKTVVQCDRGSDVGLLCMLCQDSHQLHKCPDFLKRQLEERKAFVKEKKLCYSCLKQGHNARECCQRLTCEICTKRHPSCLHDDNYSRDMVAERQVSRQNTTQERMSETANATALNVAREGQCATSMIVPVWVSSATNPQNEKLVYALLDTQSDTAFIERDLSQEMQVESFPVKLKLTTMMGENATIHSCRVAGLRVRGYNSAAYVDLPPAYTKDHIPANREHIPTCDTAKQWTHLSKLTDEIPPLLSCEVGLLLGYNCSRVLAPRQVILGKEDEPYAVQTILGWSIVGISETCNQTKKEKSICHRISIKEIPPMTPYDAVRALESDFKETPGKDKNVSQDDLNFLKKLQGSIKRNEQGHYEMPLPFKERPCMPDNRPLAEIRLDQLKRKLLKNDKYKEDYVKYMSDVIQRGEAEEALNDAPAGEKWYIPHHGIYHPKKPEKLRIVFDCSAKHKGTSLNEHLLPGPDMINNLTGVLIRFRQHEVALMCDIEKMFHQFQVSQLDRNYLRFLWWKNGEMHKQPQEYRMTVHLFGAVSSPGCANYGLKNLAKENSVAHPLGAQFITRDFYVDDGVTSVETAEKGIQLAQEARAICAEGGLRLHKFVSNCTTVLNSIPTSERASNIESKDMAFNEMQTERALGIHWDIKRDCFTFNISLKYQPFTRRGMLSTVASIYDPLGFIAPFLLKGKSMLQKMCRQGTSWDESLPQDLIPLWEQWKEDLTNLEQVHISRCYKPASFGKVVKREVHHFSDASDAGYGQCSYLRLTNEDGEIHCAFIIGKSRVSPTKITTIPRLELTAATVSVTVSDMLREELPYDEVEEFFWTDSKVVLGYINNEARRFHTFVANRVQKIRNSTSPKQWSYVPTTDNPADIASRGATVNELLSSRWLNGPTFLWEKEILIPEKEIMDLPVGDPEIKKVQTLHTNVTAQVYLADRLIKFSSWSRAVSAVARIRRRLLKDKSNTHSTASERQRAEIVIIKDLQKQAYHKEMKTLIKGKPLPHNDKLHHLDPFLDSEGVIKVGGRLNGSNMPSSFKHPTVIPGDHHVAKLIIGHFHEKVKHQGKSFTMNEIRANGFWIPGLSQCVASYIRQCVFCRRLRRPVEGQRMKDLPTTRIEPSPPFTHCGIDCFGPFLTKNGRKQHKRYGLIFTCFSSRAIHLEMLDDLSTDAFINGLRCFIALRGSVKQINCDQGTNFVGAKNELHAALQELDSERLTAFLSEKQCEFIFNAPHASHAGGVWERHIRTVRNVLNATFALSPGDLNDSSLRTILYEAAAIVNNRPLTTDNLGDPNSLEPLTPNHLITLKAKTALPPPGNFIREDLYGRKRWRQVQYMVEQFWSRWKREYLHSLMLRQRWHAPKRNIKVGDIVIDSEEIQPRSTWRLGRVSETVTDNDGLVRRVKVILADRNLNKKGERINKVSVVVRPVHKLVLLLEMP